MLKKVLSLIVVVCVFVTASVLSSDKAEAHGYPPIGAWAYGSGYHGYGYARTRTVYRARPSLYHGWGGYGNYGYSARTRVRYGYRPYGSYASVRYRSYGWPTYHASYYARYRHPAVYAYVAPVVRYRPIYYYQPVIHVPVYPVISTFSPTFCSTDSVSTGYAANLGNKSLPSVPINSSGIPTTIARPKVHLVSTGSDSSDTQTASDLDANAIPQELLEAADNIFKAGGHREAAQAYARLSVQFGSHQNLIERRFVSHVLAGDHAQAGIVLSIAGMLETEISGVTLDGDLKSFLGSPVFYHSASEALAERALKNSKDPVALDTLATWLKMGSDIEKAKLFFAAADRLRLQLENETIEQDQSESILPGSEVRQLSNRELVTFQQE